MTSNEPVWTLVSPIEGEGSYIFSYTSLELHNSLSSLILYLKNMSPAEPFWEPVSPNNFTGC